VRYNYRSWRVFFLIAKYNSDKNNFEKTLIQFKVMKEFDYILYKNAVTEETSVPSTIISL